MKKKIIQIIAKFPKLVIYGIVFLDLFQGIKVRDNSSNKGILLFP